MRHDINTIRLILICIIVSGLPFKVVLVSEKGIETQGHLKMNCLAGRSCLLCLFLGKHPISCLCWERKEIWCLLTSYATILQCTSPELKITVKHITVHPCCKSIQSWSGSFSCNLLLQLASQAVIHATVPFSFHCKSVAWQGERNVACITYSLYGMCTMYFVCRLRCLEWKEIVEELLAFWEVSEQLSNRLVPKVKKSIKV